MTPNEIAETILFWFGSIPDGLFGKVDSNGKVIKDPAVIDWLDTAIAVCLAESGGNPSAKNSTSSASGLWQIMVTAHSDKIADGIRWVETKTDDSDLDIFDPRVNTYVAGRVYYAASRTWNPWQGYTSGAYKKYTGNGDAAFDWLNQPAHIKSLKGLIDQGDPSAVWANIPVGTNDASVFDTLAGLSGKNLGNLIGNGAQGINAVKSIPDQIGNALKFLRSGAITVGLFILAIVALILGVVFILMASPAAKTVTDVIPAGKLVKKVTK